MKRRGMSKKSSRRSFRRSADRTHRKNTLYRPIMRGGIRL